MEERKTSLFDLTGDWLRLYEMADDPETDPAAFFDTMEGLEGEIEDKADRYAAIITKLKGEADLIKKQEEAFKAKREAKENAVKRLKEGLYQSMKLTGKTKFKTAFYSFYTQATESVKLDTEKVPERFLRYKEPEIDKTAIKTALKNGEDLSGIAHMEVNEGVRFR